MLSLSLPAFFLSFQVVVAHVLHAPFFVVVPPLFFDEERVNTLLCMFLS